MKRIIVNIIVTLILTFFCVVCSMTVIKDDINGNIWSKMMQWSLFIVVFAGLDYLFIITNKEEK